MNKKVRLVRGLALAGALTILVPTLAACSGGSNTGTSSNSEGSQTSAPASNFNAEGLPILNEKKTYTISVIQTSPLKAAADREAVIRTEEETNVHLEWTEIPSSAWTEKINLAFSTDTLTDAIIGEVDLARNYGMLAVLDDLLDEYAPHTTAFFDERDDYPEALRAPDGKVHNLPGGDEAFSNQVDSQYWINTEWLAAVGMDMPETTDEFKAVLEAFRDQDPNGNGEADEIPFTFESTWSWANAIDNMMGAFGVVESGSHVFLQDGEVIFAPTQQGYYDALAWLNELYSEGLIDSEVFTMSNEQYMSRSAGKDIIGSFAGYHADTAGVDKGENGDRYQAMVPLKGPNGDQMVGVNNITREGGFSISARVEDPEVLVRWYDHINSSLEMALLWGRGKQGEWWEIVDGNPKFLSMDTARLEELGYKTKQEYRNAESFGGQTPSLWKIENDGKLLYDDNWPMDWKRDAVTKALPYAVSLLPAGTAEPENTERRALLLVDMDTYLKKFISDSVINGIDDDKWAAHLQKMEQLKAEEYRTLCQDFVDSLK